MGKIVYLTGPVRSGKSRRAVELAKTFEEPVVFVATYRPSCADPEMDDRVRRHRAERPGWRILEAPKDVAGALAELRPPPSCVVLDCLTLWVSDRLDKSDQAVVEEWEAQLAAFGVAPWTTIVVGNEVGWSLVPESPVLRRFRDLTGTIGQRTAAAATEAWLMVAGCGVRLK
ncbi:cobalamin biosynthesis protein [Opitutaceae bacterium EW11]|nr:cobalamin biosynthesis protein [Opitutaceae bacterium EW11]